MGWFITYSLYTPSARCAPATCSGTAAPRVSLTTSWICLLPPPHLCSLTRAPRSLCRWIGWNNACIVRRSGSPPLLELSHLTMQQFSVFTIFYACLPTTCTNSLTHRFRCLPLVCRSAPQLTDLTAGLLACSRARLPHYLLITCIVFAFHASTPCAHRTRSFAFCCYFHTCNAGGCAWNVTTLHIAP